MKQKYWALADVHGSYNELMVMYKNILKNGFNPEKDILIHLGDAIDRGPDSKKVVSKFIEWKNKYPHWVFIKGNHEDIFEDWLLNNGKRYGQNNWFANGGKTTYESYGGHYGKEVNGKFEFPRFPDFPKEHLDFLFNLPISYETDDYFFVHGGVDNKPLEENKDHYRMMWLREQFINSNYDWGKKIIFGHSCDSKGRYYNPKNLWSKNQVFMPMVMDNKMGIDCAVCPPSTKRLACLELPEEKFHFIESGSLKYHNGSLV